MRIFFCLLTITLCLTQGIGNVFAQTWGSESLPELGDAASALISPQAEKKIGQKIMNEIRQKEPTYLDDPEVEAYLNRLGNRLAAASPNPGIGFYFFPLSDPMINAFATFGGFIGVNSGLILAVRNESELAGVLAHEISHVTQRHLTRGIAREQQLSTATLLAMAVAILAAHSRPEVANATIATGTGVAIQAQLGYSRDFEREADRIGLQTLEKAGFDTRNMSSFFSRLQQTSRVYENNAPAYLRTHPLTTERISDMQNREQALPYRQHPDSLEFRLIRARLDAMRGTPDEAVTRFARLLETRNILENRYGLAVAQARKKDWGAVENTLLPALREGKEKSPLIERLYAEARVKRGDPEGGLAAFRSASARFPEARAISYSYAESLLDTRRNEEALRFLEQSVRQYNQDTRLYRLLALANAQAGRVGAQHQALAEAYALEGALPAAIEQLELAQRSPGNDFYRASAIDARLRDLKRRQQEAARASVSGG
ncbi:MAG: M48 family metalloprotease [Betaproteobacteria bacterium]|nr:M48 family metalloprotease [Betaproteobacteria bacterium]